MNKPDSCRPRKFDANPAFVFLLLLALLSAACATARLRRSLDPDSREFLSKVRYLITAKETTTFLHLPPAERKGFIQEFWKERDPTPDTEENEFQEEYFQRIEEANHLFSAGGGGEPGWLQDRGRIYILIGPPDYRETYPRGVTFYGVPTEIWYYGFFTITYIDDNWTGSYRLDPDSAIQLAEIMKVQLQGKPLPSSEALRSLDGKVDVAREGPGKARLRVKLPYREIWFKEENGRLSAKLTLSVEARNAADKPVWEFRESYPLSYSAEQLEKIAGGSYAIEVPIVLEPGRYWLILTMTNSSDTAKVIKRIPLGL